MLAGSLGGDPITGAVAGQKRAAACRTVRLPV